MQVKLRQVRERLFMTQSDLAEKTGIAEATISRIENGIQVPRVSTVKKIARAMGVEPDELIVWEEDVDTGKAAA